jgi:hypothetical protein
MQQAEQTHPTALARDLVCVSGPHGGGKTTLIERLVALDTFKEPTFEIDFLSQFTTFSQLKDWERSLIRLYHRIFMSTVTVDRERGRCVLVSRGPLDSEAYIEAYHSLGWIEPSEYAVLRGALDAIPSPPATILMIPDAATLSERLEGRIAQGVRSVRDRVFAREDSPEFMATLRSAFVSMEDRPEVIVVRDNEAADIAAIVAWVRGEE